MLRSLYSGVSGMRGFQTKLDVIGNNIANVNTPGFKAGRVVFQDVLSQTVQGATGADPAPNGQGGVNPRQVGLGTTIGSIDTLFTPGSPMTTDVPSDIIINGDGFFVVEDSEGQRFLTRAGNFYFDSQRYLTTSNGLRVLDTDGNPIRLYEGNGPIPVDDDARLVRWNIEANGTVSYELANGQTYDNQTIALVNVNNPAGLEKVGNSLYIPTPNADSTITAPDDLHVAANLLNPGEGGTGTLVTGYLEMSNVDLTSEFTEMIVAQRAFQANSRIITTSDEVLQELVNLKR